MSAGLRSQNCLHTCRDSWLLSILLTIFFLTPSHRMQLKAIRLHVRSGHASKLHMRHRLHATWDLRRVLRSVEPCYGTPSIPGRNGLQVLLKTDFANLRVDGNHSLIYMMSMVSTSVMKFIRVKISLMALPMRCFSSR